MSEDLTISTVCLEARTRRYRINAILRRKPILEAPAEACLKALFIAERLPESALMQYLGLAPEEFDVIASQLSTNALIKRSGPDLLLTAEGKKAIDPNSEGQNREPVSDTIAFEDTAFAEAPREKARPWMLPLETTKLHEDGRPEAAQAFRDGFFAWRARKYSERSGDISSQAIGLARIASVVPLGRGSAAISAPVVLAPTSDAAFVDVSRIDLGTLTSPERRETCAEAFRKEIIAASTPQDGEKAISWIGRMIQEVPGAPALDPVDWARRVRSGEIVSAGQGQLVSQSIPSFLISGGVDTEELDSSLDEPSIAFWSPPEGDFWRLDADIEPAIRRLSQNARRFRDTKENGLCAVFRIRKGKERDTEYTWQLRQANGPFGASLLRSTPASDSTRLPLGLGEDLPQALELLLKPGHWVIAVSHMAAERAPIPIPVGVATDDPQAVQRVERLFHNMIATSKDEDWRVTGDRKSLERVFKRAFEATESENS